MNKLNQEEISISGSGNKVVGGADNSTNTNLFVKTTKLSKLFEKLKIEFDTNNAVSKISEDLQRYTDKRDTIGLEEKLKSANMIHQYDEFSWLKQEFNKKLVKYQNFEPAQEIFAFILAIVLEKYRAYIRPQINKGFSEDVILKILSKEIVEPIMKLINDEGCDDIIGITSTEIEGMFHYLTGNCHIKWTV